MAWKQESVVEQRLSFLLAVRNKEATVSELCRSYEISRKTGYKWIKRYEKAGSIEALKDQTRRPHHSPARTKLQHEQAVVAVRDEKGWGAEKIAVTLEKKGLRLRSITVHRILKRAGRIEAGAAARIAQRRFARASCNELAQMDFKGEYALAGGGKCYPLTLLDDCSRYLLGLWALPSTAAAGVRQVLEPHFRARGVPQEMLMDHGSTWYCNRSGHGLTWLSVWLIKQGITLRYSGVHHPQTQGKVERLHRTLKERTRHRGAPVTLPEWSRWAREFQQEYNCERPHAALDMKTPQERYTAENLRPYQEQPPPWEYDGGEVRKLDNQGGLNKYGNWFFICEALAKQWVRVDEIDHKLTVTFRHLTIREIDLQTRSSTAVLLPSGG
jgi:transposase InsO family protein